MQRLAARVTPAAVALATTSRRFYTPPAELKMLYQGDFDRQAYPVDIVPSDSTLFAKFLFKAAEPKGNFDAITKDFASIEAAQKKLPIFWERTANVDEIKEFSSLSAPTLFVLNWMRANGMLELIPDVQAAYETFINAKNKKAVAKIYVAAGGEKDAATLKEAKEAAQKLHKDNKAIAAFTLEYKIVVDSEIKSGYAVDVNGAYTSTAKGAEVQDASAAAKEVDFLAVPAAKALKTKFEDNIESEVLRKYFDQLAQYDAEEAKYGV